MINSSLCYTYDPNKKTITYQGKIINFYCGEELSLDALAVLNLHFGLITPQQAFIDKSLEKPELSI